MLSRWLAEKHLNGLLAQCDVCQIYGAAARERFFTTFRMTKLNGKAFL